MVRRAALRAGIAEFDGVASVDITTLIGIGRRPEAPADGEVVEG